MPELGVVFVPNATVLGRDGWVFTDNGLLLVDCAWPRRPAHPRTVPETFGKTHHLRGVCLNLTTDWGTVNYAHFLTDCLGRYGLFLRVGMDPKDVDHIYCPAPDSALTRELMERLGVPLNKCVWANEHPQITADMVLAPSYPGSRYNYPKWMLDFLRVARRPTGEGAKRIYVPRGKERNISNEREILDLARSFGFVVYDYTKAGGHDFFADAEVIMGPHGAGLTNALFAPAGCQLLDMLPSDMLLPFYRAVAEPVGVRYNYLVGESEQMRPPGQFGPSPYNFWVDPEHARTALETLTA
jgi:capsular polysaccharide biosynthesis protein